jgi:hypothetical protein
VRAKSARGTSPDAVPLRSTPHARRVRGDWRTGNCGPPDPRSRDAAFFRNPALREGNSPPAATYQASPPCPR